MTPQANDTLKLQAGEVYTIALQQATGRNVPSKFGGDQVMFSLIPNDQAPWSRAFFDPYVADRIAALGLAPQQPLEVEKIERTQGNRRVVEVVVRKAGAVMRTAPERVRVPTDVLSPQHTPPPPAPVNGTGETAADIMTRCYRDAIEVALSAQAYARENGLMIAPVFEDIRAMGTALFIQRGVR